MVKLAHKCVYLLGKNAEIVVVKLLSLNGRCAEKSSATIEKVAARLEIPLVDKEIFLLCADGGGYSRSCVISEKAKNSEALVIDNVHGTKKRCLGIKRLARVGAECGGNVKRAVLDKGVGRRVPCGISPCLKGRAKSARGEGRAVCLTLYKLLARELHYRLAVADGGKECVVLLCGNAGKRLEPMSEMGSPLLYRPVLHSACNDVRNRCVYFLAVRHSVYKRLIDLLGKSFSHNVLAEHHRGEYIRYTFKSVHKRLPFRRKRIF